MAAKPLLKIQMLGGFAVAYGNNAISETSKRSQNIWRLFKYLVANRKRFVPVEDFIDLLWADEDCANPAKALQNLVYRLRMLLDKAGCKDEYILFSNGGYAWNNAAGAEIDAQLFEDACEAARVRGISDKERALRNEKAIALYGGDFLPDSTFDEWALSHSSYYKRLYMECVYAPLQWCEQTDDHARMLPLCERALTIDPYDEHLHACYIRMLHRSGKTGQAVAHYERVAATLRRELGISPSDELKRAYHTIYDDSLHINMSIDEISDSLNEMAMDGAFFCDYDIFKHLYRLEVRTAQRSGQAVFIGLFTALNSRHELPPDEVLLPVITLLRDVCLKSLRKGDVVTQLGKSQIALLLPALTLEMGEVVMSRTVQLFRKAYSGVPVIINAKIKPLDMTL